MSLRLPPLPDRALLAQLCREAAASEKVEPALIEKDYYLTRLLWAVGQTLGERLLLKGGTLLSKVDLGFFRMSEDADLVLPGEPSARKLGNVRRMHEVRGALKTILPSVGVTTLSPGGTLSDREAHCVWDLEYSSEFGRQGIKLEVSIRPLLLPSRRVELGQLLSDPLAGDLADAYCFGLDADEARAEKVRAAYDREAIRDFYDLEQLLAAKADFTSKRFVALVDAKLAEVGRPPLAKQPGSFGMTEKRRKLLRDGLVRELPAVLRKDAPDLDLSRVLRNFDRLWKKSS